MKSIITAMFVFIGTLAVAQAQQQREPETPSLQETANYLGDHLTCNKISWNGTSVTFTCHNGLEISIDAMSLGDAGPLPEADQVWLSCRSGVKCVTIDFKSGREDDTGGITLHSENAAIRDNVVRALSHFFHLLKQQNMPADDPFGPK